MTAVDWKWEYKTLWNFLGAYFPAADDEGITDDQAARQFVAVSEPREVDVTIAQAEDLLALTQFPAESVGDEANRWFEQPEDGRCWLRRMIDIVIEERRKQASETGEAVSPPEEG